MAPKIDTSCSTASGSVQKLRNARGSTQPGRYEQLRVAHGMILADREAKKARSTRQARQIPTSSSDSDTTLRPIAPVIAEKHARKARSTRQARQIPTSSSDSDTTSNPIAPVIAEKHAKKTSVIWQHMSQKEVNGRTQTICKYCGVNWFLGGSTSNALRHLKVNHPDRLTECNAPTTEASGGNHKNIQYKASTAATAPALANFAMIMANNNAHEYVKILKELYKDNGLQAPDFSKYLS